MDARGLLWTKDQLHVTLLLNKFPFRHFSLGWAIKLNLTQLFFVPISLQCLISIPLRERQKTFGFLVLSGGIEIEY